MTADRTPHQVAPHMPQRDIAQLVVGAAGLNLRVGTSTSTRTPKHLSEPPTDQTKPERNPTHHTNEARTKPDPLARRTLPSEALPLIASLIRHFH